MFGFFCDSIYDFKKLQIVLKIYLCKYTNYKTVKTNTEMRMISVFFTKFCIEVAGKSQQIVKALIPYLSHSYYSYY